MSRHALLSLLAAPILSGCVYYNRMWSAERFARQARQAEARGDEGSARAAWTQAAVKAESVHAGHPGSKWADDAWVLHAEGAARGGSCAAARAVIGAALVEAGSDALRERVALLAAECALALGAPGEAERQLGPALASREAGRASRAAYLAGRIAEARGDLQGAIVWYARSRDRTAGPARVRALLAGGDPAVALALMDTVARGRFLETDWAAMLDAAGRRVGPAAATEALDRMLRVARIPAPERARLLLADADRRYAAGHFAAAADRYRLAARAGGELPEGRAGRVRALRARVALAGTAADLEAVQAELARMAQGTPQGGGSEASALATLLERVAPASAPELVQLRGAELARDSLGAATLAGQLFVTFAERHPESLFAPKALVAALPLLPERHDSLLGVLRRVYGASPYVAALRGEASPAYAGLEDSLARAFGVALATRSAFRGLVGRAPVTGPRGPWWDEVFPEQTGRVAEVETTEGPVRRPARPPARRPGDRPNPPERPASERPADS